MPTTDIPELVSPDLARVRALSRNWGSWQGLYAVLLGVTMLIPRGFESLALIAFIVGIFAVRRYYRLTLGFVQPDGAKQSKRAWIVFAVLVALFVGSTLFVVYADRPMPKVPPAFNALWVASWMVLWWQLTRREHSDILFGAGVMVAWAATLALGLPMAPRLGQTVTENLSSCLVIAHGVRTHFTLMRFVRSMQGRAGVGAV